MTLGLEMQCSSSRLADLALVYCSMKFLEGWINKMQLGHIILFELLSFEEETFGIGRTLTDSDFNGYEPVFIMLRTDDNSAGMIFNNLRGCVGERFGFTLLISPSFAPRLQVTSWDSMLSRSIVDTF
eukprot:Gb_23630 [translate_table: standard]